MPLLLLLLLPQLLPLPLPPLLPPPPPPPLPKLPPLQGCAYFEGFGPPLVPQAKGLPADPEGVVEENMVCSVEWAQSSRTAACLRFFTIIPINRGWPSPMLATAARTLSPRSAAPWRALLQPARAGAHRRPLVVQAAGGGARWREEVTFVVPGEPAPLCCAHVTQRDLDSLLSKLGALGFKMEDGKRLSQRLEDLPPTGDVTVVLPSAGPAVRAANSHAGAPLTGLLAAAALLPQRRGGTLPAKLLAG